MSYAERALTLVMAKLVQSDLTVRINVKFYKYGKDYELEIYAKRNDDYQLTQEEQEKIIKKNQRKMSNTSGIYFELATTWYPKRFTFVTKSNLPNIFKYITKS